MTTTSRPGGTADKDLSDCREGVGKVKMNCQMSCVCHDGAETRIDSMPNTGKARCSFRAKIPTAG